jgi:hypothetical protein
MTPSIVRLYNDYVAASDAASRSMSDDRHQARVYQIEADICSLLSREPGGTIIAECVCFKLYVVTIGDQRLSYFRAGAVVTERRVSTAGYSFARRRTDISPPAPIVGDRPTIRRKREVAQ